jgi:glycosyltransferase involved in cell wall biosynthesis
MWLKIRKQVPDATLDVYYGWESWVGLEGEDDFYQRMEAKFEKYKEYGVTVHGRVSHQELADAMKEIQVWAYPTQFTEIHCITALKAQEAGCYPVTTNVAALAETVQSGDKLATKKIYIDEYQQQKFIKKVVEALKEGKTGTPVPGCDWLDVAMSWSNELKGLLDARNKSEATA